MKNSRALVSMCFCVGLVLTGCGSGIKTQPAAILAINPTTLTFASTVGQTATAQTVTLINSGDAAASLTAAGITGTNAADFAISATTCGASLSPSSSCTISVTFTPSASGTRAATLNVTNALTVALSGTANSLANVTVTPPSLTFAATVVGQTATAQIVTVANTGGTAATLGAPTLTGTNATSFAISANTCTTAIAANATCTISVTFTPSAPGAATATLNLSESSLGVANTFSVSLSGSANPANVTVKPPSLSFTSTAGQVSAAQVITVSNTGGAAATLGTPSLSGTNSADFAISANTCTTTIAAGGTCTISVTFSSGTPVNALATLGFSESSFGVANTFTVSLSGSISPANVTLTPPLLGFGSTLVNATANSESFTLTNSGGAAATISVATITGPNAIDFAIVSTTCTTSLAANSFCTYSMAFTPTDTGTRTATFNVTANSMALTSSLMGTGAPANLGLLGNVSVGSQVVSGATIQLYTVGATGNASAARAMLTGTTTTNAAGNFYLASGSPLALNFNCGSTTDQVYVVSSGGNPTTTSAASNTDIVLVTALGNCGALTTSSTIAVNPLTTAAAAWTLAQFASSATNVGASSTNAAGMRNAMLDAQLLTNSSSGAVATVAANIVIEPGKLAALADALASCASVSSTTATTACAPLFTAATPSGGSVPTNTFAAALSIVKHPAQNVAAVYALIASGTSPYTTTFTQAPNDWTLNMSVSGGGIKSPTGLAIDANGNIWAAGYFGVLSGYTPQGSPLSSTGYGSSTTLSEVYGLTIDSNGNLWATNQVGPTNSYGSVTKFTPSGVGTFSSIQPYYDSSISYPVAVAADTNGDIFIANYASSAVTVYSSTTNAPLTTHGSGLGTGSALGPVAVAADASHGVWIANSQSSTVTHVNAAGALVSNLACCAGVNGSNGIATDSAGNAWISDFGASAFSVISTGGTGDAIVINEKPLLGTGLTSGPAGVAVDSAQNVFVANFRGESVTELAGISSGVTLGTQLSPSTGFGYPSPSTATPILLAPEALVPDASGNLWVTNNGNNNLVVFFGLAAPTKTPVVPTPIAP